MKIFSTFAKWVGRLPLAGKLLLRPLLFRVYAERDTFLKLRKSIIAFAVLVIFILAHAYQAYLGYQLYNETTLVTAKIFSILYVLANCFATYAQIYLCLRLSNHLLKYKEVEWWGQHEIKDIKFLHWLACIILTGGGQAAFIFFKV